jgi:hypothetical protein
MEMKYKIDPKEWQNMDVHSWAIESFELSKKYVYSGVKENESVS